MKKNYLAPNMHIVTLQSREYLLSGSIITDNSGNSLGVGFYEDESANTDNAALVKGSTMDWEGWD